MNSIQELDNFKANHLHLLIQLNKESILKYVLLYKI